MELGFRFGVSWLMDEARSTGEALSATQHARQPEHALRELPAAHRTVGRCAVCGFTEVITDEVVDRGWILLAECPHCDHRWTETLAPVLAVDAPAPRRAPAPVRARPAAPAAA